MNVDAAHRLWVGVRGRREYLPFARGHRKASTLKMRFMSTAQSTLRNVAMSAGSERAASRHGRQGRSGRACTGRRGA